MDKNETDKSTIEHLFQDMRVKLRDMDDFIESIHYKRIFLKFQKGFEEV